MQRDDVGAAFEMRREPASVRPENAGRVRFVDDQHGIVAVARSPRDRQAARGRRPCCKGFRPRSTAVPVPPAARHAAMASSNALRVVVASRRRIGLRQAHAVVSAGMDELVIDDQSPRDGNVEADAVLAMKPPPKNSAVSAPKNCAASCFERLVLGMVAAQQPRAARPDRHAARDRLLRRRPPVPATARDRDSRSR